MLLISEKQFYKSKNKDAERLYEAGVCCLQTNDFYGANAYFKQAAEEYGHTSAYYNLALINGMGQISPYNVDFAVQCFRQAATRGHPKAKEFLFWLDKAEDTSFGTIGLSMWASKSLPQNEPNHILTMTGCRLYSTLCKQYNATDAIIQYELDALSNNNNFYIKEFIKRTGIKKEIYHGGLNRLVEGSAAEQISDGLNSLYVSLKKAGNSDSLCLMIRCTIVGYIISKSSHSVNARPLLGFDKFFQGGDIFEISEENQKSDLEKLFEKAGIEDAAKVFSELILKKLPTVKIAYQFILEEIEAASQGNDMARNFARNSGINSHEYKGSMSNSFPEVDGPDGPQQTLLKISMQLMSNQELMVKLRTMIVDNIMKKFSFGKYQGQKSSSLKEGIRLKEAEVDILFIVHNNTVIYSNKEADALFETDKYGDEKLDGRVVNFVFKSQSNTAIIEMFVAFDYSESYTMFTLRAGMMERLNYVADAIYNYFSENSIPNVFSPATELYTSQYIYSFHLYRKNETYFMINNSQTQAYLIDGAAILRDDIDEIKRVFWGLW